MPLVCNISIPRTSRLETSASDEAAAWLARPVAGVLSATLLIATEGTATLRPERVVATLTSFKLLAHCFVVDERGDAAWCGENSGKRRQRGCYKDSEGYHDWM